MSTDQRYPVVMVERLPDQLAQLYERTKKQTAPHQRHFFKHRKLKAYASTEKSRNNASAMGSEPLPSAPSRESQDQLVKTSPSRLPMSLPMYSRSTQGTAKVSPGLLLEKVRKKKRKGLDGNTQVVQKIKIRRVSEDASPPKGTVQGNTNTTKKAQKGNCSKNVLKLSKAGIDKYEIVSLEKAGSTFLSSDAYASEGEKNSDSADMRRKEAVEAWLRDQAENLEIKEGSEASKATGEDASTTDGTSSYAGSYLDQEDTESYHSERNEGTMDSEVSQSQGTEINVDPDNEGSDTEIEEAHSCSTQATNSSKQSISAFAGVMAEAPVLESKKEDEIHAICSNILDQVISDVCSEVDLGQFLLENNQQILVHSRSDEELAGELLQELGDLEPESIVQQEISRAEPDLDVIQNSLLDLEGVQIIRNKQPGTQHILPNILLGTKENVGASIQGSVSVTDNMKLEVQNQSSKKSRIIQVTWLDGGCAKSESPNSCLPHTDIIDLTNEEADCYVVGPTNTKLRTDDSNLTGVCMTAAKELDLFANMTILESWDCQTESMLSLVVEYLVHLEKCLTILDLMQAGPKSSLMAALRHKANTFQQIFAQLKGLLHNMEHLGRVHSVERGFCQLLGLDLPVGSQLTGDVRGTLKEPNSATRALMRRLSADVVSYDTTRAVKDGIQPNDTTLRAPPSPARRPESAPSATDSDQRAGGSLSTILEGLQQISNSSFLPPNAVVSSCVSGDKVAIGRVAEPAETTAVSAVTGRPVELEPQEPLKGASPESILHKLQQNFSLTVVQVAPQGVARATNKDTATTPASSEEVRTSLPAPVTQHGPGQRALVQQSFRTRPSCSSSSVVIPVQQAPANLRLQVNQPVVSSAPRESVPHPSGGMPGRLAGQSLAPRLLHVQRSSAGGLVTTDIGFLQQTSRPRMLLPNRAVQQQAPPVTAMGNHTSPIVIIATGVQNLLPMGTTQPQTGLGMVANRNPSAVLRQSLPSCTTSVSTVVTSATAAAPCPQSVAPTASQRMNLVPSIAARHAYSTSSLPTAHADTAVTFTTAGIATSSTQSASRPPAMLQYQQASQATLRRPQPAGRLVVLRPRVPLMPVPRHGTEWVPTGHRAIAPATPASAALQTVQQLTGGSMAQNAAAQQWTAVNAVHKAAPHGQLSGANSFVVLQPGAPFPWSGFVPRGPVLAPMQVRGPTPAAATPLRDPNRVPSSEQHPHLR